MRVSERSRQHGSPHWAWFGSQARQARRGTRAVRVMEALLLLNEALLELVRQLDFAERLGVGF